MGYRVQNVDNDKAAFPSPVVHGSTRSEGNHSQLGKISPCSQTQQFVRQNPKEINRDTDTQRDIERH